MKSKQNLSLDKFTGEIAISVILIALLLMLLNSVYLSMSSMTWIAMNFAIVLFFVLFIGFVWREKVHDEREEFHRHIASRFAYLSGIVILGVAVVAQSFKHWHDPWIIIALCVMVLSKLIGMVYSQIKH